MSEMFDHDEKSAARILGLSPKTLRSYRQRSLLGHYVLPGGRIRYSTEQLAEFVRSTRVASVPFRDFPLVTQQG